MRSRAQDSRREEKSGSRLDSGGVARKQEAGNRTARESWGQGARQRRRKQQQGERKRGSRRREKERDRDQQRRMGSGMETQKNTWDEQHDREGGKKNRGRDPDRATRRKTKNRQRPGQRGRNETTGTGSRDRKQWREAGGVVDRWTGTTQNKPHSYTLQGREGGIKK